MVTLKITEMIRQLINKASTKQVMKAINNNYITMNKESFKGWHFALNDDILMIEVKELITILNNKKEL